MQERRYDFDSSYIRETLGSYTARTFFWMFLGLLVTFSTAWWGAMSGVVLRLLFTVPGIHLALLIAELVVVVVLSRRIYTLQVATARVLFFAYALITGLTFSTLFVAYDLAVLILAFGVAAIFFGVLAAYGYLTKSDLSRLGPVLRAGLIVLAVFGLLSLFLPLSSFDRLICLGGIAVFIGLTAYDTQKMKAMYYHYSGDPDLLEKVSVIAALELYLDFLNLFLYLLRFLGKRSRD